LGLRRMSSLFDLVAKRKAGHVRVSFTSYYDQPLLEVLARFGLGCSEFHDPMLREVDRAEARSVLVSLLSRDMAYNATLMTTQEAEILAEQFLQSFSADARFMTNLERPEDTERPFDVGSSPITESTFDAGIICLAKPVAGCVWFEDED
jgi:hypothetical protein